MTETGLTHHLTLPDASENAVPGTPPLHLTLEVSEGWGVTLQTRDAAGLNTCDLFVEHYDGLLVAHLAPAGNPDQHRYRVVLGRVQDGQLVPYEPTVDEADELEIDTRA